MPDLTKSFLSLSWALPLFGVEQMANFARPERAAAAMGDLARATGKHLGPATAPAFKMGDELQKGMVEVTFSWLGALGLDPGRWMQFGTQMMDRSFDAMRGAGCESCGGGTSSGSGWGPMPGGGEP